MMRYVKIIQKYHFFFFFFCIICIKGGDEIVLSMVAIGTWNAILARRQLMIPYKKQAVLFIDKELVREKYCLLWISCRKLGYFVGKTIL